MSAAEGVFRRRIRGRLSDHFYIRVPYQDDDGNTKYKIEATKTSDRKKAKAIRKSKLAKIESGDDSEIVLSGLRYDDLEREYKDHAKANRLNQTTVDTRLVHLTPFFKGKKALKIDYKTIRKYTEFRQKDVDQSDERAVRARNATINREINTLRRMFTLEEKKRKKRFLPIWPDKLPENDPRQGFLDFEKTRLLLAFLPDYLVVVIMLFVSFGWRKREGLDLIWSDSQPPKVWSGMLDLKAREIRLRPSGTKSRKSRVVKIPPILMYEFQKLRQHRDRDFPKFPYVFFRLDRQSKPQRIVESRRAWQTACVKAGLGERTVSWNTDAKGKKRRRERYKGLTRHDLCRTGIRNLVRSGCTLHVAQKASGRLTDSTIKRYDIVDERDFVKAAENIDALWNSELQAVNGSENDTHYDTHPHFHPISGLTAFPLPANISDLESSGPIV